MPLAILLDAIAAASPIVTMLLLIRKKGSSIGLSKDNLLRLSIYFLLIVFFDSLRNLGIGGVYPVYGTLVALGVVILSFGHVAAIMYFCPESKTLAESLRNLLTRRAASYQMFNLAILTWLVISLVTPFETVSRLFSGDNPYVYTNFLSSWYLTLTTTLMIPAIVYPGVILFLAITRAKSAAVRRSLWMLLVGWYFLSVPQLIFYLTDQARAFASEIGLVISSVFFILTSTAFHDPSGIIGVLTSQLAPQPILRAGKKYLLLHDGGKGIFSFLSVALQNLIEAGGRIVIRSSPSNWILDGLIRGQPRFANWLKSGRIISAAYDENVAVRETFSERLAPGPTPLTYVRELETGDLHKTLVWNQGEEKHQLLSSEVFLIESSKAPRPLLSEFLRRNDQVEVLNLSETRDTFSNVVGLNHQRLQGSKILLEYDSSVTYEEMVDRFFTEGVANAEYCALFTVKSSKLYRNSKGRKMVKMIAASSLVSSLDELPDGEVQIPDRELGLVASIVSELFENNKTTNVSIVFDSIPDLIMGDQWEQTYSGIKQLFELVSVPNATAIFLANRNTMDPRLLAAIRSFFSVQLRLDSTGLKAVKLHLASENVANKSIEK